METTQNGIRRQAEHLAAENRQADPAIQDVFWFPHPSEVRLVETTPEVPASDDNEVHPFYFPPAPQYDLPSPSAVALIRPDEARLLQLPDGWVDWGQAVTL